MNDDEELAHTMEALDRLVSWATAFKRQPLTEELTVHQAGVLHVCGQLGPLGQDELGRLLGSAPSTITALVHRLERTGLLRRERDPEDGRKVQLHLTKAGQACHADIEARSRTYTRRLFQGWTPEQVRSLRALLERFVDDAQGLRFDDLNEGDKP